MTDVPQTDTAPLSTSKRSDAVEQTSAALIDDKGDTLVGKTVTINRPRQFLFDYWRDFSNLPRFMDNVERVDVLDETRSHWVVKAPAGHRVEWDAIITEEEPGEFIAWSSMEGADVPNSGRIDFKDATTDVCRLLILALPRAPRLSP